jgi:hypothetical protein
MQTRYEGKYVIHESDKGGIIKHHEKKWCGSCEEHHAANGFHGIVYGPTHFLAGEAGRERVNISPLKKKHKSHHEEKFWDVSDYFGGKY